MSNLILVERICIVCGEPVFANIGDLPDKWVCSSHEVK